MFDRNIYHDTVFLVFSKDKRDGTEAVEAVYSTKLTAQVFARSQEKLYPLEAEYSVIPFKVEDTCNPDFYKGRRVGV